MAGQSLHVVLNMLDNSGGELTFVVSVSLRVQEQGSDLEGLEQLIFLSSRRYCARGDGLMEYFCGMRIRAHLFGFLFLALAYRFDSDDFCTKRSFPLD